MHILRTLHKFKIMAAYAALVSVMHIIDDLELHPRPPISLRKKQLHLLTAKLSFLQEFLESYNPHLGYSTEADPLEIRIADAAHAAEDVIESHIVHSITNDGKKMTSVGLYKGLKTVIEEMALIEKEAMKIEQTVGVKHQMHMKSTPQDSSRSSYSAIAQNKSRMVGADDVLLEMKDKLTSHCRDLQIIPIVGMGGTGKTTLARIIYQDGLIKEYFDRCAWTTISQEYSVRQILVEVLKQLNTEVSQDLSEGVIGEMLYKQLYGRKYFIVMDDMWSTDAWDRVRNYFPNNKNGSRIVITTRLSNLASQLSSGCDNIEMELLDEADSWDLLSITVFAEKPCPLKFEKIGKKIAKGCKGLPLSIVVVGGLLAKSKHTRRFWKHIEENLNAVVNLDDDKRCLKILYMSYKQLPIYLKPCFLYMGVFPEDDVIRTSRIMKLWIAEGFLKPVSDKRLEEMAKEYLKELADRNLIEIHKKKNMKYCKIHDLLRDLSIRESRKERFYTIIGRPPIPQGEVIVNEQRRIVMSRAISKIEAIDALSSMSIARSLMCNLEQERVPPLNFRLLRVLESCRSTLIADVEFLENMHQLVNSRFLAIWAPPQCKFPSSIRLFWNLKTLFYSHLGEVTAPTDIWSMPHIRHVEFFQGLRLPDPPNGQNDIVLGNLHTLLRINDFKCSEQVVKRIPNIKKLQIYYHGSIDDDRYCLSNLDCLDKLASLSCVFSQHMNPSGPHSSVQSLIINFPESLNKLILHLNHSQCWEDVLDKIGALPLLQKLQLFWGSFREGQWETAEGQFPRLKSLSLRTCIGLQVWIAESSHFPCLEHLFLGHINDLKEIPLDFADIPTLRMIEVYECNDSVVLSAKRILDEQEDLYGEEAALQVEATLWNKRILDEQEDLYGEEAALQVEATLWSKNDAAELMSLSSPNFHLIGYYFWQLRY